MTENVSYSTMADRIEFSASSVQFNVLNTTKLTEKRKIKREFNDISLISDIPLQMNLSVPKVSQQPHQYACWAACVKAIGMHFDKSYSIEEIYGFAGIPTYNPTDIVTALNVLNSSNYELITSYNHNVVLPFTELTLMINDNNPIMASNTSGNLGAENANAHAVVIRGYVSYTNSTTHLGSISYMNPWNGSYMACGVTNSNQYEYINSENNRSGFLTQFGIVSSY